MDQKQPELNGSALIDIHGHVAEIICQQNRKGHTFSITHDVNPLDFSFPGILLEMSIILILSHILYILLKPLKQPRVISGILAGIIVGPSVLGQNETFAKNITPESSQFVIQNIGIIGFMLFLFVTGVKMDLDVICKAGKKHFVIALAGMSIPYIILWLVAIYIKRDMDPDLQKQFFSIGNVASAMIITSFPVVYTILKEMQLLSSEIGRLVLTTVIIGDFIGVIVIIAFEAYKQGQEKRMNVVYYLLTTCGVSSVVVNCVPLLMQWINKKTPQGEPVEQNYIIATLLGVFVMGFTSDFIGASIGNGPLWLGLAIPDGPPVGATIVQKSEVIMNDILMPFAYATVGFKTDVFAICDHWTNLTPIFALVFMAIVSKFLVIVMAAGFSDMSCRDSLTVGFMLSLRGQMEFLLCLHWMDLKIIKTPSFSMLVIVTIIVTVVVNPIIHFLYDPTRPYMINKKRTIQHAMQECELRILACIYDEESVASLFSFLDFANSISRNPLKVYSLHLIELLGRSAPVFIDHTKSNDKYWDNNNEVVHNAIQLYEESHSGSITINFFTSVTPNHTMYQDICEVALSNKVGFILLPFHKKFVEDGNDFSTRPGVQYANANILSHAPCSVGILACKNAATWGTLPTRINHRIHRQFVILFLGGPDAREALSLADRMVEHPDVSLIVVRFLANECKGDDVLERRMDDGVVTSFWVKHERNKKLMYKEVVVSDGSETISAVRSFNHSISIDLWIVGRKKGINPNLLTGLSPWSDNPELGILGDFLASVDFNTPGSVLVVQQQVLRY